MRLWLVTLCASLAFGCAAAQKGPPAPKDRAEKLYLEGLAQYARANYLEAQRLFADVIKMPAYLRVTPLGRVRLGDTLAIQGKHQEAIQAYQSYLRRHAGSSETVYARFRVAQSHFRRVPTDFWILPPVHEMDLSSVDRARYHLESFIRRYPTSTFVTEAMKMRDRCLQLQLAQHRYVIAFYRDRKKPTGVVFRSHKLLKAFPVKGHTRADYSALAAAYGALGWRKRELELRRVIARRWPSAVGHKLELDRVAKLRHTIASLKAGGAKDAEMPLETPPMAQERPEQWAGPDGARGS